MSIRLVVAASLALSCGGDDRVSRPSVLDPGLSEPGLRAALGVPEDARRVLVLSQSSHLDIDWRETFDAYYEDHVEGIFGDALALLERDDDAYYAVAEMAYLAAHVERHGAGAWRQHMRSGRARIVGGGLTTPDTLLPTEEALVRDYLLGSVVAEQVGARPRAAWLPDSFGHSPTAPDLLAALGFSSVGFGRADGARHTFEILFDDLEPILPGADTTASRLRELGSADFVWRGPGGGEVLAHYMPVREYCQGDTIDLDGFVLNGARLGVDHEHDREFVLARVAEYVEDLEPYRRTPYLFVPVGCDFQRPRPGLTEYAAWWNEARYDATGVWVVVATFEDYARLVGFHRAALPVLERDITPVWSGFYGSRPRVKRLARAAAEALAGIEPFLLLSGDADVLGAAWRAVALADHHDWITGTATDEVVAGEQVPELEAALARGEEITARTLEAIAARVDTRATGAATVVFNRASVRTSGVVEIAADLDGPIHAAAGGTVYPAQPIGPGRVAVLAADIPAFGWRSFTLEPGAVAGATIVRTDDAISIATGRMDAHLTRSSAGWALDAIVVDGEDLIAGASLEWIVYEDSGGLYRIGSERPDCEGATFTEVARIRFTDVEVVEPGPARVTLRASAELGRQTVTVDLVAEAAADRLVLRIVGAAPREHTIALRVRPRAPETTLTMGVAAGVAERPLEHVYVPSWWPAVTWVARGELAVHLTQSTGVRGTADGALEWIVARNATSEQPCDEVGPSGTEDAAALVEVSLGRRDRSRRGATELEGSITLARPLRGVPTPRHGGDLAPEDALIAIESRDAVATALKRATRGGGVVLHLVRFGAQTSSVTIARRALDWDRVTRPDLLERDDVAAGTATDGGIEVALDAALVALRLQVGLRTRRRP
jgi:hypothetical protein